MKYVTYELRWRYTDGSTVFFNFSRMPLVETIKMAIEDQCDIYSYSKNLKIGPLYWRNPWLVELEI